MRKPGKRNFAASSWSESGDADRGPAVLIVAFNEAEVISDVVSSIPPGYTVYVVDDGSVDDTAELADSAGARVVRLPVNCGQGSAAILGYKIVALAEHSILIKMDGDGQHDPNDIPGFEKALISSGLDMVIGSRVMGSNYAGAPLARRIFLGPLTKLLNLLTGYNLTDAMCGFRAFGGESLKRLVPVFDEILEPEYMASEMLIRFSRYNVKVGEIPIHLKGRKAGYSYKGMFKYGMGIAIAIIRTKIDIHIKKDAPTRTGLRGKQVGRDYEGKP